MQLWSCKQCLKITKATDRGTENSDFNIKKLGLGWEWVGSGISKLSLVENYGPTQRCW